MTHDDRVALIRAGVDRAGLSWADLGAGTGAFTFALAALLGPNALVHAVDRDDGALRALEQEAASWRAPRAAAREAPREVSREVSREASLGAGGAPPVVSPGAQGTGTAPRIVCVRADFTQEVDLPPLDGALLANALHFHEDACGILRRVAHRLKPGGVLILVEYDIERSNPWVPHPLPWSRLPETAACAGLPVVRLLGTRPSRYHRSMYAASCAAAGSKVR